MKCDVCAACVVVEYEVPICVRSEACRWYSLILATASIGDDLREIREAVQNDTDD